MALAQVGHGDLQSTDDVIIIMIQVSETEYQYTQTINISATMNEWYFSHKSIL